MDTSAAKLRILGSTKETVDGTVSEDKTLIMQQYNQVH